MKEGMQNLLKVPDNIKDQLINRYGSLEEYYFEIWYNRHEHYTAYKMKNSKVVQEKDNEYYDFENEIENLGMVDGSDIIQPISDDHSEMIVMKSVNDTLGKLGWDKNKIKEYINSFLRD